MIPLKEIQVVEFSVSQKCYHVESMYEMLETNLLCVFKNMPCDYVPIGFFDTYEAAANFIAYHKAKTNTERLKINYKGEIEL